MSQYEKTSAMLNGIDFTNHDPGNLLNCFYEASAEAQRLAQIIDQVRSLTKDWPEAHWIAEILGEEE